MGPFSQRHNDAYLVHVTVHLVVVHPEWDVDEAADVEELARVEARHHRRTLHHRQPLRVPAPTLEGSIS